MKGNAQYLSLQGGLLDLQTVIQILLLDQLHLQLLSLTINKNNNNTKAVKALHSVPSGAPEA